MSRMWLGQTCVPTTPLFSHSAKYPGNYSTHNEWRAPDKVESNSSQKRPGGRLQADRHTDSAVSSNTQQICDTRSTTDTTQRAVCKTVEDQAARPMFRPPGPTISETPRSFSCCRFAIPMAHFSKRSAQIMHGLIQTKILNMNFEKDEIISWKSTCA